MRRLVSDTLVIAERNLIRLPRAPDLLLAFTVQPIMFVLLFRYVFGGAISTPGYSYVDFLIPGIIVQNIAFGGFVTALGLNEDVHKGLIDRFRSLPMARPAVLAGRTLADVVTNALSMTILLITGIIIGFSFQTSVGEVIAGIGILLLFGYAFSWVFAFLGLLVSSPEAANSVGFIAVFPLTFISSAFVPVDSMPEPLQDVCPGQPVHDRGRCDAGPVGGRARGQQRVGCGRVVAGDHRRVRAAGGGAVSPRGKRLRKSAIAATVSPGSSVGGECWQSRWTRVTGPRAACSIASSWAIVPYWSRSPWISSSGQLTFAISWVMSHSGKRG